MRRRYNPWLGRDNLIAHPDSPAGGAGNGFFRNPEPLGVNDETTDSFGRALPDPRSPATRHDYYADVLQNGFMFDITKIPYIMIKKGWLHGASFLTQWFKGSEYKVPATVKDEEYAQQSTPDRSLEMQWVLSCPRILEAYQEMIQDKIWVKNERAKQSVVNSVKKMYGPQGFGNERKYFGDLSASNIPYINNKEIYVNFKGMDVTDEFDDWATTIGQFVFRVAVKGYTEPSTEMFAMDKQYKFVIEEVGTYIRDSFDFTDTPGWFTDHGLWSQPLGYWGADGPSGFIMGGLVLQKPVITNQHFNIWRDKTHHGRDFLVLSKDMKIEKLNPPDTFIAWVG